MPYRHRIFIAINLPENIKKRLASLEQDFSNLPARWTKVENLHFTLIFLGYLKDDELFSLCQTVKEVARQQEPFLIKISKITYGPLGKMPPRMIWASGEKSIQFTKLKENLEKALLQQNNINFALEKRAFSPHITLGRILAWQWQRIDPEERPEINKEVDFNIDVNSIEVMESQLKRSGPSYIILESYQLLQ